MEHPRSKVMHNDDAFQKLYRSLRERRRPEDVAQLILEAHKERLPLTDRALLEVAARGALKRHLLGYTSMLETFRRPVGMAEQVGVAENLFETAYPLSPDMCDDPDVVEQFVRHVGAEVRKTFGQNEFKHDRLDRSARKALGLDLSRRRYNKLFRHLARMEQKLTTLTREWKKLDLMFVAKSGLAAHLPWEEFAKDVDSACFIAYYTARCNLRSEFTNGKQRPFDQIAERLFARCRKSPGVNWWAIAHVYPTQEVLAHLSDEQKGELLARWFTLLQEIALLLRETWDHSDIDRATMVVRRGNDSSTWNTLAGAWNRARDHWIALLYASGLEAVLDGICPGKALRLMAADVVAWHDISGGSLDPNTLVWRDLPLPWEVLLGERDCTRGLIETACRMHNLDPEKGGWTAPRPNNSVAEFRPTPELVHGVTVHNPYLAKRLRKAGWFSGTFN